MVKISVLQHAPADHLPMRPGDPTPTSRNLNPVLHPFAKARERTRAMNAAKMDRMFAKPFVGALDGHTDAVEVIVRHPSDLTTIASANWDGGIILHNLAERTQLLAIPQAHKGKVTGLCYANHNRLLSCGVDKNIKLWSVGEDPSQTPLNIYPAKYAFNSIDHHRSDPVFATASNTVQIWDETKSAPISNLTFPTATETLTSVRFNLSESSVLASIGSDRSFTLCDIRTGKAERRIVLHFASNALAWCPTFPTTVLLASEDHNLYTFDVRWLDRPQQIYKGHVAAVTSCAWSPTGLEFVSGGWDRTIRLWRNHEASSAASSATANTGGRSGDIYHTKRMQRVSGVVVTADARFVCSASEDANVRVWKMRASERLGIVNSRERQAREYRDSLIERWRMDEEVGAIVRRRHLPKAVYKTAKLKHTMLEAKRVKEERRRKHTRAGDSKPVAQKRKVVVAEQT